jgi:hypothetical protein
MRVKEVLDGVLTVSMIGLIGVLGWRAVNGPIDVVRPPEPPAVPSDPVSLEGVQIRGAGTAPWMLLAFEDFNCSACRMFEQHAMPTLLRDYVEPGRLRFGVHTLPLQSTGAAAEREVSAAACAAQQGRFWEFREAMFTRLSSTETPEAVMARIGMTAPCVPGASAMTAQVKAVGKSVGLRGAPHFLLGRVDNGHLKAVSVRRGIGEGDRWLKSWLDEYVQ